jgi:hypothetical protein
VRASVVRCRCWPPPSKVGVAAAAVGIYGGDARAARWGALGSPPCENDARGMNLHPCF